MFHQLQNTIDKLAVKEIASARKQTLQPLIKFIQQKIDKNLPIRINFVCTHNSRRSHLAQIWAQTMAYYFNINNVFCYSAGTEATAIFPMIIETLQNTGFHISGLSNNTNPIYAIKYAPDEPAIVGFSKTLKHLFNPTSEFAAVMTCSDADKECPIIEGAEQRIAVTYNDPKIFDNTSEQQQKYHERSVQIASEMYYVFSQIRK